VSNGSTAERWAAVGVVVDMVGRTDSLMAAILCLCTLFSDAARGTSNAAQRAGGNERTQLDVTVSTGNARVPDATVIAAGQGHQHVASATTDWSGRAQLIVPPGQYLVSVLARGRQAQTTAVRVHGGDAVAVQLQVAPLDPFALVPPGMGVVSGRVVTKDGQPVPYAMVGLDGGNAVGGGGNGLTSADGAFRFNARVHPSPNGAYRIVRVSPSVHFPGNVPPVVFVPDTTELAQSVQVREKQETGGLELQVATSPLFRVTVTLRDELGSVPVNSRVTLYQRNGMSSPLVKSDGTATLGPFPPGPATVWASGDGPGSIALAGVAELEIVDRAVDDVVVTMVPAARLRGRVEFSNGTAPSTIAAPMLVQSSVPGRGLPGYRPDDLNGRVAKDATFALRGLLGPRCLELVNLPAGWRLEAILRAGRDITDEPVVFAPAEEVTDVVFRLVPGDMRGTRRPRCGAR
jgi:hypothetical protein